MSDNNDMLEAFEQYAGQPEAMIHWDDDSNQYLPNTSLEGDGHQLHSMAKRAAYFFTQRLEDFAGGYRWQSQQAQGASAEELAEAMQWVWNDVCSDTGCVPADFEIRGPKTTRVYADFIGGSFAEKVLMTLSNHRRTPPAPAAEPEFDKKLFDSECRESVAGALGFQKGGDYAWSYLLEQIKEAVAAADMLTASPQPAEPDNQ